MAVSWTPATVRGGRIPLRWPVAVRYTGRVAVRATGEAADALAQRPELVVLRGPIHRRGASHEMRTSSHCLA